MLAKICLLKLIKHRQFSSTWLILIRRCLPSAPLAEACRPSPFYQPQHGKSTLSLHSAISTKRMSTGACAQSFLNCEGRISIRDDRLRSGSPLWYSTMWSEIAYILERISDLQIFTSCVYVRTLLSADVLSVELMQLLARPLPLSCIRSR